MHPPPLQPGQQIRVVCDGVVATGTVLERSGSRVRVQLSDSAAPELLRGPQVQTGAYTTENGNTAWVAIL